MPCFTTSFSSMTPRISGPSATTSGVEPARAMRSTISSSSSGTVPPCSVTQRFTESAAPLRIWRPSMSRPDIRVVAENGHEGVLAGRAPARGCRSAPWPAPRSSGPRGSRRPARPAGRRRPAPPRCARRPGRRPRPCGCPRVMVPVLSSSRVWTSPAASTARPLMASTLRWTRRSMPAMPMADSSAPMVVGIRQTSSDTRMTTETVAPGVVAEGLERRPRPAGRRW